MYIWLPPSCQVPRAALWRAHGTHASKGSEADFDCHTEQIYIYARNEAAAKSQLLLSKIGFKAYYCAPVKIPEQLTGIIKLESSKRPTRVQGSACQHLWEQKYFFLPSLLELQTHLETGNEGSDQGEREHSSPDHSWQTAGLQCTGLENMEAFRRKWVQHWLF